MAMQMESCVTAGAGREAFCSGGDQSVRGKGGYVGADGVPRLNVLDLQVLRHDSSVSSCLHAALLVLLVLLFCMLLALHTSKHQSFMALFCELEILEGALMTTTFPSVYSQHQTTLTELGFKTDPKSCNA